MLRGGLLPVGLTCSEYRVSEVIAYFAVKHPVTQ